MPTGYTSALDEKDLSTAQWLTEHLARAYGVCMVLRDGPYGLSADEIEKHLEDEIERGTKYHRERLTEAKDLIEQVKANPKVLRELHSSVVKQRKEYNAERVILFGSYARGEATEDSDVDILVIAPTAERFFERMATVLRLTRDLHYKLPLGPIVLTKEEVEQRLQRGDQFVRQIIEKGVYL